MGEEPFFSEGAEPEGEGLFGGGGLADLLPGQVHGEAGLPHVAALAPEGLVAAVAGGALLAMLFYNLMLFVSLRDRSHLYYVGYLAVFGVAQFGLENYDARISETADLDAAILADDLPPDAYLDGGFINYATELQKNNAIPAEDGIEQWMDSLPADFTTSI